jgi:Zn finger protein HypA/HybF involved in hydrogenase expression
MMKPNETVRYECEDCRFVFDLTIDSVRETEFVEEEEALDAEPSCCPFCGAGELRAVHDSPAHIHEAKSPGDSRGQI